MGVIIGDMAEVGARWFKGISGVERGKRKVDSKDYKELSIFVYFSYWE